MNHHSNILVVAIVLSVAGCAGPEVKKVEPWKNTAQPVVKPVTGTDRAPAVQREIVVNGVRLENDRFDIPVVVNSQVERWVDYFTGRGRDRFKRYLERSDHFIPYIIPILDENNMPRDLVYLAMIESGFNNHARSRARAVGPWQFMQGTARRYGLNVNWWADERRNIRKSTIAAIRYLRDLHYLFNSWELAAAGYNAGEFKIAKAIKRFGTRDYWALTRHRYLRLETRNYVPKMMAAAIVAKNRRQFGFKENYAIEKLDAQIDIKENPTNLEEPVTRSFISKSELLNRGLATPHTTRRGQVASEDVVEFEIQSPADLLKVARAAGVSYQLVKSLNPEVLRWCTPPGQDTYRISLPSTVKDKFLVTYNHPAFPREVKFRTYRVRRGDTLRRIARRFGIRVEPLKDLNGYKRTRTRLVAGKKIKLPLPTDRTRNRAAVEVRRNASLKTPAARVAQK